MTFGVRPHSPHTGYGYIHRGRPLEAGAYEIQGFKEKPDLLMAGMYVASGEYYWNSGMFVWRVRTILDQYEKHQPEMARVLRDVAGEFDQPHRANAVLKRFSQVQRISVDFAIMEKADHVVCVELPCRWLDVGSWPSLADIFPPDSSGNTVVAPRTATIDSTGNILVSETDHLIAAVGVQDLIVVHSPDATLICSRADAQRIKDLVQQLGAG